MVTGLVSSNVVTSHDVVAAIQKDRRSSRIGCHRPYTSKHNIAFGKISSNSLAADCVPIGNNIDAPWPPTHPNGARDIGPDEVALNNIAAACCKLDLRPGETIDRKAADYAASCSNIETIRSF